MKTTEKIKKIFLDNYKKEGWKALRLLPVLGIKEDDEIIDFILSLNIELPIELRKNTVHRSINHGWGNGYVKLDKTSPYYGVNYEDIYVPIPGGVTYSEYEGDKWVIGFDTYHSWNDSRHDYNYVLRFTVLLLYYLYI